MKNTNDNRIICVKEYDIVVYSSCGSLMAMSTPIRIKNEPTQKVILMVSPKIAQPKNVPTTGWKKKKMPPLEALSICSPRFHKRKAREVDMIPR